MNLAKNIDFFVFLWYNENGKLKHFSAKCRDTPNLIKFVIVRRIFFMKKGITLFIIIVMELFLLMATAIGLNRLETVLQGYTMTALVGMVNLGLGFFLGRTPKKKKRKARPSPTPQRRAPLSKAKFSRDYDVPGPG